MHPMLNTAIKAARRGATVIQRASNNLDLLRVERKAKNSFVTEVDRAAEHAIIETLLEAYPTHAILAEEAGARGDNDYTWIIDPLDGTTNYLHGVPQYCISIALAHRGQISQAVVYDPCANEMFTATRGGGAFLNDRRIRVSKTRELADSLIGTGLPYTDFGRLDLYMRQLKEVVQKTAGVRRPGAAALDLAYVACGRFDAFWEMGLNSWDIAAGSLLVLEAGGLITDLNGDDGYMESGDVIAGSPKPFAQLLQTLQQA